MPFGKFSFGLIAAACLLTAATLSAQKTNEESKEKPPLGKLLLLTGVDRFHNWSDNSAALRKILEDGGFLVVMTEEPWVLTTEGMKGYDGIAMVYNSDERWPAPVEEALVKLVTGGMGIGIIHSSDNSFPGWKEFEEMVGLLWRIDDTHQAGHDHFGPLTVKIVDQEHFITRGVGDFPITDELYRDLTRYSDFHVLAEAFSKDKQRDYPIIMTKTYGQGRVFHTVLGHNPESMNSQGFKTTTLRGMLWAIKKDK
ncbi:MAG TPA: ThuA domain-containing protein [archaeon]|nr:ThuA domain-containing protein [archaeon]